MNACFEAAFDFASSHGYELYAATGGFDGLINNSVVRVDKSSAWGISHVSGCNFKCGRSQAFKTQEGLEKAVANIKIHGFEALIILGGNGSFVGVGRLKKAGVNAVGIPATIDNDVFVTNHSLGFSSACESAIKLIDNLKSTMLTNNRDHVVQLMGRHCSALTCVVGEAAFADVIDTVDKRYTAAQVANIFGDKRKSGKQSCLMVMQEKKAEDVVSEAIESAKLLGAISEAGKNPDLRMTTLGHLQRGAPPSCRDRWLALNYARTAINAIVARRFGTAVALVGEEFILVEL